MQLNQKRPPSPPVFTHEGGRALRAPTPEMELRRSVMSCMLWEDEFYESGEAIADRIKALIPKVTPAAVARIAVEAREKMKLRHVPLLLVREMARIPTHKKLVADTLEKIIQRPDELSEFVALYWKDGKQPLSAQVKKGLARAFNKFSEHQLAKYNRDRAVKLRDVMFLSHPKPQGRAQEGLFQRLANDELKTPDTWEVALSAGEDKKATWERLLGDGKLGGLALLRNLRNMREANVAPKLVKRAIIEMNTERVLPYRFIAAARFAPDLEPELETAMFRCLEGTAKLPGRTCILVDVSGSMDAPISSKSDLHRLDAACGLAMLLRELCDDLTVCTFSNQLIRIAPRRGFALRDLIVTSQGHGGTALGAAVQGTIDSPHEFDRVIVITDEQSNDSVPTPPWKDAYVINVASAQNGVGYGEWTHLDGWSEALVDYIREFEGEGSR